MPTHRCEWCRERELGEKPTVEDRAEKVADVEGALEREVDLCCGRDVCHAHDDRESVRARLADPATEQNFKAAVSYTKIDGYRMYSNISILLPRFCGELHHARSTGRGE